MIKKLFHLGLHLSSSKTARHLYWIFSGNVLSIILTFFTTILIARNLNKADNGIFLALFTLSNLLSDLGEAGLGAALSNFVPPLLLQKKQSAANEIIASAFQIELLIASLLLIFTVGLASYLANNLFAHTETIHVILTGFITFTLVLMAYSIFALSAYQKFREVAVVNIAYSFVRLLFLVIVLTFFKMTLFSALLAYLFASTFVWLYSLVFLKTDFLYTKSNHLVRNKLLGFSRFTGLQKVFISLSGRLDLLMLVPLAGAIEAGVYGIASRFALVYPLVIGSLGQVLAPKFAEFAKAHDALGFFKKVGLLICGLLASQALFYIFAQPLILVLVPKYAESIPVFRWLLVALVPFVVATPFVSFLIYTLKKPHVITFASGIQLLIIFAANWYFLPKLGRFAPAIGLGIGNLFVCAVSVSASWYYVKKVS